MFPCPGCGLDKTSVIDSRADREGVRRRRKCLVCEHRFTTVERLRPDHANMQATVADLEKGINKLKKTMRQVVGEYANSRHTD